MSVAIKNLPGLQVTTLENTDANLQRLGVLNDSYRKRYATYTKIAAMVVVFLVGFIAIQMLEPMVPPVFGNILMIVLILVVGYYLLKYFGELSSRSPLNYDELNLPTKNPGDIDKTVNLGSTSGDLGGDFSMCMDDSCCGTGSKYSSQLKKCIPNCNSVVSTTNKYYKIADGTCTSTNSPASDYIDTSADGFTLANSSQFESSGDKYVDKNTMPLLMSNVGNYDTGLIPSNEVSKYASV